MRPALSSLSLRQKLAQLIFPKIPALDPAHEPVAADAVIAEYEREGWGGFIVFEAPKGFSALVTRLNQACRIPLLGSSDLERGAGQHLAGSSHLPSAMAIGATGDPDLAYQAGALTAREARQTGIHWVFAPVADVNNNPDNPIINIRSFGSDPEAVGRMAEAWARGCQDEGVLACVKHFPGHGDTAVDSHSRLPVMPHPKARLERIEFPPFRQAIVSGVGSVMASHLAVPSLDASGLPATLSALILGTLRLELGFEGLIVTDALNMGGLDDYSTEQVAVMAISAGCDILLMPPDPLGTLEALVGAVDSGQLSMSVVDAAVTRVLAAKERLGLFRPHPEFGAISLPEAQELSRAIARASLTLGSHDGSALPLQGPVCYIVLDDDDDPAAYARWISLLAERNHSALVLTPDSALDEIPEEATVVIAAFSMVKAWKERIGLWPEATAWIQRLVAEGKRVVVVSTSNPYLGAHLPGIHAFICTYSAHPECQAAAMQGLHGELPFPGRMPVSMGARAR